MGQHALIAAAMQQRKTTHVLPDIHNLATHVRQAAHTLQQKQIHARHILFTLCVLKLTRLLVEIRNSACMSTQPLGIVVVRSILEDSVSIDCSGSDLEVMSSNQNASSIQTKLLAARVAALWLETHVHRKRQFLRHLAVTHAQVAERSLEQPALLPPPARLA